MAIDLLESVKARLTAYIAPNRPISDVQKQAFDAAVEAQAEYERETASVQQYARGAEGYSISNDGVTVSVTGSGFLGAAYTESTLHPFAWALLNNAGLLRKGAIPTARRI